MEGLFIVLVGGTIWITVAVVRAELRAAREHEAALRRIHATGDGPHR